MKKLRLVALALVLMLSAGVVSVYAQRFADVDKVETTRSGLKIFYNISSGASGYPHFNYYHVIVTAIYEDGHTETKTHVITTPNNRKNISNPPNLTGNFSISFPNRSARPNIAVVRVPVTGASNIRVAGSSSKTTIDVTR